MSSSTTGLPPRNPPSQAQQPLSPLAGVLSYLVPGLGQISQGRVGKGLLFLVCVYAMFFYGVYLGSGSVTIGKRTYDVSSNVYLPNAAENNAPDRWPPLAQNLYTRPQFAGQFWVGVAAWPAIFQYLNYKRDDVDRMDGQIDDLKQQIATAEESSPQELPKLEEELRELKRANRHPFFGQFQREPSATAQNALHNASDKRLELAWVYTVIAGVLNILVIYDALAGPAYGSGAAIAAATAAANTENKV